MPHDQLIQLIQKYLSGECTSEEKRQVENWYEQEGDEHLEIYQNDPELIRMAADRSLLQIRLKLSAEKPSKKISLHYRWLGFAAAVLLLISVGGYFVLHRYDNLQQTVQNNIDDIEPGGNKAILTLSNGQQIMLNDAKSGQLASQNNVMVNKTAEGQISYQSSGSGQQDPDKLIYNTIATPQGGIYSITLSDGTKVFLNAASSMKFPATFAGLKERKVELTGEAYFVVQHDARQPFRVQTKGQIVEDIGTVFNITSYAGDLTKTTLVEGSISVNKQILKPGQQSTLRGQILDVSQADLEEAIAWKDGYFKFNENLESMMGKISRWYNVEVIYDVKPDPALAFAAKISRTRNLSEVLSIIEKTGGVHFKIEGRRVTVMK